MKKTRRAPSTCQPTVLYSPTTLETSLKWWMTISQKLSVSRMTEVSTTTIIKSLLLKSSSLESIPLSARNLPPSFWDSSWVGTPSIPSSTELYSADPYSTDPWHNYMAAQMAVGGSYSAHQMYTARSYSSLLLQSRREWVEQNSSSSPYASMTGRCPIVLTWSDLQILKYFIAPHSVIRLSAFLNHCHESDMKFQAFFHWSKTCLWHTK